MAKIEFTGFVDPWSQNSEAHPDWGMKVVEPHRNQNEAGEWETRGRTWRTVKAAYETPIDFTRFKKGDRVTIVGRELTETREVDGKKYYTLTVKADSVVVAASGDQSSSVAAPVVSGDAPF